MARVLIVEPEPDLRQLAEEAVRELGHEPLAFADCPEGVRADVAVLVPTAGLAERIAHLQAHSGPMPVICTATRPRGAETDGLRPVAHLVKPYRLGDLQRALDRALEAREPM